MKKIFASITFVFCFYASDAQPIPPDSGNSVTPISGIACLVVAGAGIGAKKLWYSKSDKSKLDC